MIFNAFLSRPHESSHKPETPIKFGFGFAMPDQPDVAAPVEEKPKSVKKAASRSPSKSPTKSVRKDVVMKSVSPAKASVKSSLVKASVKKAFATPLRKSSPLKSARKPSPTK